MRKGLTAIEVVVAIVALVLLVGMLVPFLGQKTHCGSGGKEAVNLQNIQRSMATYAASNKDYFPGLTATGNYISKPFEGEYYGAMPNAASAAEEASGDGCTVSTGTNFALAMLLDEAGITPAQMVSPGETGSTSTTTSKPITEVIPDTVAKANVVLAAPGASAAPGEVHDENFSFAMLAYGRPTLKSEWKATANPQAVVLATRLIFNAKPGGFNSVWTDAGSGRWMGWTVRNDGSTEWARKTLLGRSYEFLSFSKGAVDCFGNLKYGAGAPFDAATESSSTVGIFGRSTDMKNFDASAAAGQIGSAND